MKNDIQKWDKKLPTEFVLESNYLFLQMVSYNKTAKMLFGYELNV